MGERVVWTGDRNPLTPENLAAAGEVWIRGADYKPVPASDRCYVHWNGRPVLSFGARESEDGGWEIVMRQSPQMRAFPDKVMDRYEVIMRDLVEALTREEPTAVPTA